MADTLSSFIGQVKIGNNIYPVGSLLYGTCDTAANTAAKVVNSGNLTTDSFTILPTGITIHVKFTNSNTIANPTLKIGNTDAKSIKKAGTTAVGQTAATSWIAGAVVSFTYDGTNWVMNTGIDSNDMRTPASKAPEDVSTAASIGTSTRYAREDHVHKIAVAQGSNNGEISIGGATVKPKNIADAAYKSVSTSIPASGTTDDAKLPTVAAVKALVTSSFAANDAMVFKGTLGTGGTITDVPTSDYSAGATYKIITAGTYAGMNCEVGDMLIAINDGPETGSSVINADWTVVQTNIDGAVTGPASSTANNIALYNDATGKVIKDSGITINSSGSATKWLNEKGAWTTPTASNVGLGNVTNAAQITKATFTAAYQIMYSTAASAPAVLNANTTATKKFLSMTGTGSAGAAPAWSTLATADISDLSSWTGSSSITTLGTVSTGTWSATTIAVNKGGTGKTSWTQWGVLYASASTTLANTAAGSAGQLLKSNGTSAPTWSTFSKGTLPSLTGSDFTASVSNGTLTLTASTRSFSQGSLPSFS